MLISLCEHVIIPPVVPLVTNEIHSFVWSQIFAILFHGFLPLLIGCEFWCNRMAMEWEGKEWLGHACFCMCMALGMSFPLFDLHFPN